MNKAALAESAELQRLAQEVYSNIKAYQKSELDRLSACFNSGFTGDGQMALRDGLKILIDGVYKGSVESLDHLVTCITMNAQKSYSS